MTQEVPVSKREMLTFVYKYQRQLLYAFFIPLALCVLISFIPTPRYKASSMLIIRLGAEYVYNPEVSDASTGATNPIPFSPQQIFKSEVAILNSEDLHAEVINAIGMENLFPELVKPGIYAYIRSGITSVLRFVGVMETPTPAEADRRRLARAVELFDKRFDIQLEKESAVIDLSFENKDAHLAAKTLETLLSLYMEKRKTLYNEPRVELARTEMQASHERAVAASNAVQKFKLEHNLYSVEDERQLLLQRRDKALEQSAVLVNANLEDRISDYNKELARIDALDRDLSLLQKEEDIASDAYALASHKYDEAKAFEDVEHEHLDSVRIIQPPSVPAEPRKLRALIILAGTVVSLFSLLTTASVLKFLETGFTSSDQAERLLNLRVLATLNASADPDKTIRPLVQSVSLTPRKKPTNVITFFSARKSEGTSPIAQSYASRLAKENDARVLLVDAGVFSPNHFRPFGFIPQTGIIDMVLRNRHTQDAIHHVSDTLSVCRLIGSEQHQDKIHQIVSSEAFWKELLATFGNIVIDAGSLQESSDGITLAAKSDAVVIVTQAETTPQAAVKNLRDTLIATGSKIEGVVMNQYNHYIPDSIYKKL